MSLRAAVIGDPVAHSLSPRIFAAFAAAAGVDLRYRAIRVPPASLAAAVRRARSRSWLGWNVTLPHKVAIMPLLDALHDSAREAGAVNVVHFTGGRAVGYNTDGAGLLADLRRLRFAPRGKRALVLGSGGAARAVCAALKRAGVAELGVLARDPAKGADVAARFGAAVAAPAALAEAELVVNASSAGLDGRSSPLPARAKLKRGALAYDLVYRPAPTPFLRKAKASGCRTADGTGMLLAQAAETWAIWLRQPLPPAALRKAESAIIRRR